MGETQLIYLVSYTAQNHGPEMWNGGMQRVKAFYIPLEAFDFSNLNNGTISVVEIS